DVKREKGKQKIEFLNLQFQFQRGTLFIPQVLKKCAEFIEKFGIVDGIYRLSGVTSNIQRLRYLEVVFLLRYRNKISHQ
uniref:Rho-GAP domain-containing protein n=1 Tax=Nothobranchius furzeri TaxID=105023 RepID=A0A8C6KUG9_NOTFU